MKKIIFSIMLLMMSFNTVQSSDDLRLTKKMINGNKKVIRNSDGSIIVLHGGILPTIKAAPLKLTDIQLEEGEIITDIQIGDTVRWQIAPTLSGTSDTQAQVSHVVVKAFDANLSTILDIFTDRRSYHINLVSTDDEYNPIVTFAYADNLKKQLKSYNEKIKTKRSAKKTRIVRKKSTDITRLNFNYKISGSAIWKPTKVFTDGRKTYIKMPDWMESKEAPALLVITKRGEKIVNYRLQNNTFVVDYLFDRAFLILGVGINQEKITITRFNASKSNSLFQALGF